MAVTVTARIYDSVRGRNIEIGTFTLDPASLAANTEVEETVTISGAGASDQVIVNPRQLDAGLVFKGARVTAANTVGVTLRNITASAVDGASRTWDYILIKAA